MALGMACITASSRTSRFYGSANREWLATQVADFRLEKLDLVLILGGTDELNQGLVILDVVLTL